MSDLSMGNAVGKFTSAAEDVKSIMFAAVKENDVVALGEALEKWQQEDFLKATKKFKIELINEHGHHLTHIAAWNNGVETLKFLKEHGFSLMERNVDNNTPAHCAVFSDKNIDALRILANDPDVDLTVQNRNGYDVGAAVVRKTAVKSIVAVGQAGYDYSTRRDLVKKAMIMQDPKDVLTSLATVGAPMHTGVGFSSSFAAIAEESGKPDVANLMQRLDGEQAAFQAMKVYGQPVAAL